MKSLAQNQARKQTSRGNKHSLLLCLSVFLSVREYRDSTLPLYVIVKVDFNLRRGSLARLMVK